MYVSLKYHCALIFLLSRFKENRFLLLCIGEQNKLFGWTEVETKQITNHDQKCAPGI